MAHSLSRRVLANHISGQLIEGVPSRRLAQQLAAYLIESGRLKESSMLLRDINESLAEKGYVNGTVVSAHQLSETTIRSIEQFTKEATRATKVTIDPQVDTSMVGGLLLQTPGYQLDSTVKRQLTTLRTRYKKA